MLLDWTKIATVAALSPMRHLDRLHAPVVVAYGTCETPEFQRQNANLPLQSKMLVRRCGCWLASTPTTLNCQRPSVTHTASWGARWSCRAPRRCGRRNRPSVLSARDRAGRHVT